MANQKMNETSVSNNITTTGEVNHTGNILKHWILDSGASDHVICSPNYYTENIITINEYVQLPNHDKIPITHIGDIRLNKNIILKNALCVPSFKLNLISVGKTTTDNDVCVMFIKDECLIFQTHSTRTPMWTLIGKIKQEKGLYEVKNLLPKALAISNKALAISQEVEAADAQEHLWHFRLGHPSLSRLSLIEKDYPNIKCKAFSHCKICQQAKQHRLPFSLSNNNSNSVLDLLRCDLWGSLFHFDK